MDARQFIYTKYHLENTGSHQIEIPNMDRDDLSALFAELKFNRGVEVGVKQGFYSAVLCSKNPDLHLDSIDCWKVYTDSIYGSQDDLDAWYEETKQKLSIYPNSKVIRDYSILAANNYEDEELDFVYIDANHRFKFIYEDISIWYPKVRSGGIMSGHDFLFSLNCNVGKAVMRYTSENNIRPLFIVGRKRNDEGEKRDASRSWFWIKE